jgi:P4 family phage/plasmid primase-like protien
MGQQQLTAEIAPKIHAVNIGEIPEQLQTLRWALWNAEYEVDSRGLRKSKPNGKPKIKKAPKNALGVGISKNRPEQWLPYRDAVAAYAGGEFSGIGVLMEATSGLVGIDLDDVKDLLPQSPDLIALVKQAKAKGIYCEQSPSGTGLRLFVGGHLPDNRGRRQGGIELYADVAFLTVTGRAVWPGEVKEAQWLIDALLELIGGKHLVAPETGVVITSFEGAKLVVVDELSAWASGKYPDLWAGHWDKLQGPNGEQKYPSQSEADMALVGWLAREALVRGCAPAYLPATVLAAFRKSGLYRYEKEEQIKKYALPKVIASAMVGSQVGQSSATISVQQNSDEHGDVLNGKIFTKLWRDKFLFVANTGKWLRWYQGSSVWVWCHKDEALHASKDVGKMIMTEAARLYSRDPDKARKLVAHATKSHDLKRLEAMLKTAASEPGMSVTITELDNDPWSLGVRNGVVNLKTGALKENQPDLLITRSCDANYDRHASCPRWLKFLDEVFAGDTETIETVQRALGYTLTGDVTEEVIFICFGFGSNGKSVFNNVVSKILGDYGRVAPASLLTARRDGDTAPRNDLAALAGSRYVSINELQSGDRLDEQIVKFLAGREKISARFLHKEFFEFMPTFACWLRTNHKPIVTGDDDGIWRRLVLIPFAQQFKGPQKDPHLEEKLLSERDAILTWMVDGALKWKQDGLSLSQKMRRECASYRKESDLLGEFIDENCKADPDAKVLQSELFERYRVWSQNNGVRSLTKITFTRRLAERGFPASKSNGDRFYTGLKLVNARPTHFRVF